MFERHSIGEPKARQSESILRVDGGQDRRLHGIRPAGVLEQAPERIDRHHDIISRFDGYKRNLRDMLHIVLDNCASVSTIIDNPATFCGICTCLQEEK